jgi:hypothetical protein
MSLFIRIFSCIYQGHLNQKATRSFLIQMALVMANCIKTLGAYYGRPTWFEKVFPSSRPWSVRTVAPPKLTLGTDLKTKFVTMTVLTVAAFVYIIFMLIYVKIVRLL